MPDFSFRQLPCVALWTQVDLAALTRLTRAMALTSPKESADSSLVIGLVGTLGAGKTRFCQEIATAFGVAAEDVTSPTFTLIRSYKVTDPSISWPDCWHHLDLYRVADEDELWELGIEELWEQSDAWTLMEWADRFADLMPAETVWIEMLVPDLGPTESGRSDTREIRCYCQDPKRTAWLRSVAAQLTR